MGIAGYQVHEGNPDGPLRIIYVPTITGRLLPAITGTIPYLKSASGNIVNTSYTYLSNNAVTASEFRAFGFRDIIVGTASDPVVLYFTDEKYLTFNGSELKLYVGDDLVFNELSSYNNRIKSMPSAVLSGGYSFDVIVYNLDTESLTASANTSDLTPSQSELWYNFIHQFPSGSDPLEPGGTSETGGGNGSFDDSTSPVDFADDPDISAVSTGMVSLFTPTITQINALANYLWSNAFDLDNFKKMFADPMSAIIGLSMVPVAVPSSGAVALKFGGWQTDVSMNKASSQYVNVDCGSVSLTEWWGSALDYNPYTKVSIYLPFIGIHELDTDEIMGQTISVKYKIDILSGACVAQIRCGSRGVLYQFSGSCSAQIPVSNRDWSNVIGSAVSVGLSAIAAVASGGASAAAQTAAGVGLVVNSANAVQSAKVNVSHSGGLGGMAGFLGNQTPYLIIKRARQALPNNYNKFEGYPSTTTARIGSLRGFTQVEEIHLSEIPATSAELAELENILKGGIII